MSRLVVAILLVLAVCAATDTWARRTTRRNLGTPEAAVSGGRLSGLRAGMISVGKYDKPLRSRHESVFVTNHTDSAVVALKLRLRYLTMEGDTMHEAVRVLRCDLPPRSTRRLTFSSWDKQQTLYYYLTDKPSRLHGTPYKIDIVPEEAVFRL